MSAAYYDDLEAFAARLNEPEPFWRKVRYFPWRKWSDLKDFWLGLKAQNERRTRHFARSDVWSFHHYNAVAQVDALKRLRAMAHGHPVYDEVQTMEEWFAALDTMIDGWQAMVDIDNWTDSESFTEYTEACQARFEKGMYWYVKFYGHLWD